jgi:hypothetical protein
MVDDTKLQRSWAKCFRTLLEPRPLRWYASMPHPAFGTPNMIEAR